jgi:adenylate cyclase class 2
MDPDALTRALDKSLGIRALVEKARRLIIWREVRIHLDAVAGLGTFVELEAVSHRVGGLPEQAVRINELREALGITDDLLIADGYADLFERAGRRGLRP